MGLGRADHVEHHDSGEGDIHIINYSPELPCLGFGVVRAIDVESKLYYIVTPVPEDVLATVNILILVPPDLVFPT